ncbi:hypothetical protein [Pseudarthrobacter sp. PS3-L1]|uniref:hypothetical protein n=1 Tax=Pseudarthrobacter sp. PS3-L1 TaxID=3046207 RepID=UPI0024B8C968|nr:hypothetical protein [Pseudarthrobacter sp. PS3-L1]MDJ0318987.1 hypothetical protein [Pseudarthrobacter sp. PS3-L1]
MATRAAGIMNWWFTAGIAAAATASLFAVIRMWIETLRSGRRTIPNEMLPKYYPAGITLGFSILGWFFWIPHSELSQAAILWAGISGVGIGTLVIYGTYVAATWRTKREANR